MADKKEIPESHDAFEQFHLMRIEDESGVSGTGVVARGCVLPSGKCVLEWLTFTSSLTIYDNIQHVVNIHGHQGKTKLIMGVPKESKPVVKKKKKTVRSKV